MTELRTRMLSYSVINFSFLIISSETMSFHLITGLMVIIAHHKTQPGTNIPPRCTSAECNHRVLVDWGQVPTAYISSTISDSAQSSRAMDRNSRIPRAPRNVKRRGERYENMIFRGLSHVSISSRSFPTRKIVLFLLFSSPCTYRLQHRGANG